MPGNHEYILDVAAFETWQRENSDSGRSYETLLEITKKVIENELDDKEKAVLYLYYDERLTLEAISKHYGVSPSAIWKQLKRTKHKLYVFLKYTIIYHYEYPVQ